MDLYLLKVTIRKKKPLRSFYVMTANMDFWFWEVLYEYIIRYGSGQPPENRLDLGPSGGLRTDARTLEINLSIKTRETEPSEM